MAGSHLRGAAQHYLGAGAAAAAVSVGCHGFTGAGRRHGPRFHRALAARTNKSRMMCLRWACMACPVYR